jgi:DtxR family Mn-dependent transcriptional regulator
VEISFTEENYIKAIFSINRNNSGEGVTTTELSDHLQNKAASVTDMLKRLADKKLIVYERYKSVHLTPKGEKIAVTIVRKHRLWEVFLMEKLKFRWDEVHEIAEQLEHIKSDELVLRLDEFLGKPRFDPHGDPIPDAKGNFGVSKTKPLHLCEVKKSLVFMGVSEHSPAFLQHLTALGLKIGDELIIIEKNEFDNSLKVRVNDGHKIFLSEKVSSNLLVKTGK